MRYMLELNNLKYGTDTRLDSDVFLVSVGRKPRYRTICALKSADRRLQTYHPTRRGILVGFAIEISRLLLPLLLMSRLVDFPHL